ncbi:MAG: TylF/MycF/NovP-related O-methyltransferase [Caldimonas sp.]
MGRFRLSSIVGPRRRDDGKAHLDMTAIDRYWREAHGGDPFLSLYQRARTLSGSSDNVFKQNRHHTLAQMADRVISEGISGDVAECGCFKGHSTYIVAERLQAGEWPGRFFVFDSFEGGLSEKTAADRSGRGDTDADRTKEQKLSFASSRDAVAALLQPFTFVSLHEGWIPAVFDTVAALADRRFALVHVDVDLYEPTRDSLAFFGPRMSPGGVIVIDDYGSANFPGCKVAVDEYRAAHRPKFFLESHLIGAVMLF